MNEWAYGVSVYYSPDLVWKAGSHISLFGSTEATGAESMTSDISNID